MRAGSLRYCVEIQTLSETPQNGVNGSDTTNTFTTVATVWADIKPVKGLTYLDTKNIGQGVSHELMMRYYPASSENWILFDNRRFRIRSIENIGERNRITKLLCEEDSTV